MAKKNKGNTVNTATERETVMLQPADIVRGANLGRFKEAPPIDRVEKLAESIKEHGQLAPVGVRKTDAGYELVYGWTRVAACEKLGQAVRCEVIEGNDTPLELSIRENLDRNELSPMDKVSAMHRLHNAGKSKREISQIFGCAAPWVTEAMKIADLPNVIKDAVDEGRCGMRAAVALTKLKDDDERITVFTNSLSTEPDPENPAKTLETYDSTKIHKEVEKRTGVTTAPAPAAEAPEAPAGEAPAGEAPAESGKKGIKARAEDMRDFLFRLQSHTSIMAKLTPGFVEYLDAIRCQLDGKIAIAGTADFREYTIEEFEQATAKFGGFQTSELS